MEVTDWREFWQGYRRRTGDLTWRLATPEDLPAILRMRKVMERYLGQKQDTPMLFQRPILLTLVAEDESGKVVDGMYVEAQVEILKLGCTLKGFEESAALADDLHPWLKSLGFRFAKVTVSKRLRDKMGEKLRALGFKGVDTLFSYWARRL